MPISICFQCLYAPRMENLQAFALNMTQFLPNHGSHMGWVRSGSKPVLLGAIRSEFCLMNSWFLCTLPELCLVHDPNFLNQNGISHPFLTNGESVVCDQVLCDQVLCDQVFPFTGIPEYPM